MLKDEIRIMKINSKAINEIVIEVLTQYSARLLDIETDQDDVVFSAVFNEDGCVVFSTYMENILERNEEVIQLINDVSGITTSSIFSSEKVYISKNINTNAPHQVNLPAEVIADFKKRQVFYGGEQIDDNVKRGSELNIFEKIATWIKK